MQKVKVWDLLVRAFHWVLVGSLFTNMFLNNPEKSFHHYVGYLILFILLIRISVGLFSNSYAGFKKFPLRLHSIFEHLQEILSFKRVKNSHIGHSPLGSLMVINIYAFLCLTILSGYLMTTELFWGVEWPEEMHKICVTWLQVSIVSHVSAVLFESFRLKTNLPKSMITGYKDI